MMPQGPHSKTDLVVHLAGTGDHGFERRLHLGFPLIKQVKLHFIYSTALLPGHSA